jgi:hypothetical protein
MRKVTISIFVPARAAASAQRRRPQYVSAATKSASISVDGGTPTIVNLMSGSSNCPASGSQGYGCTATVTAAVGPHTFVVCLYSQPNATGPVLSTGTATATIGLGVANTVSLTLDGVAASITISLANTAPTVGTPVNVKLVVNVLDASGAIIVGSAPYTNPVTLTDSDTSGATKLSSTVLTSPSDVSNLTLNYTGAALAQAIIGATASGIGAKNVTIAALTPIGFNDYTTYGYDKARDGYNPNSAAFTPQSLANLHLAWQVSEDQNSQISGSQTQPIVATNVNGHPAIIIIGGTNGDFYGLDARSGTQIWAVPSLGNDGYSCTFTPQELYVGVGGTPAYDPGSQSFYVTADANTSKDAKANLRLYHFSAASGAQLGSVDLVPDRLPNEVDFAHTAVTIANGLLYAGIGSTCDKMNTRGRVVAVNPATMQIAESYYTNYGQGGNAYVGGGVWGWGGVSVDGRGNVFTAVGNTWTATTGENSPPAVPAPTENSGLGDHFVELSGNLNFLASNAPSFPFGQNAKAFDLDFTGTPTLFQPLGCDVLAAAQGKAGQLVMFDTQNVNSGPIQQYQLSEPTYSGAYLGNPAYSPVTGLLYANVASSQDGSIRNPGLIAIQPSGCNSFPILWSAVYGPDSYALPSPISRGVPAVTAGGVVFASSPCAPDANGGCSGGGTPGGAVWALDASSGLVLNGGKPVLFTPGDIRMEPTIDGNWMYVYDNSGDLYALTLDPSVPAIQAVRRRTALRSIGVPSR